MESEDFGWRGGPYDQCHYYFRHCQSNTADVRTCMVFDPCIRGDITKILVYMSSKQFIHREIICTRENR